MTQASSAGFRATRGRRFALPVLAVDYLLLVLDPQAVASPSESHMRLVCGDWHPVESLPDSKVVSPEAWTFCIRYVVAIVALLGPHHGDCAFKDSWQLCCPVTCFVALYTAHEYACAAKTVLSAAYLALHAPAAQSAWLQAAPPDIKSVL